MKLKTLQENLKNYQKVKDVDTKHSWIVDYNHRYPCDWCGDERLYEDNYRLTKTDKIFKRKLLLCEDCRISFYRSKKTLEKKLKKLEVSR